MGKKSVAVIMILVEVQKGEVLGLLGPNGAATSFHRGDGSPRPSSCVLGFRLGEVAGSGGFAD